MISLAIRREDNPQERRSPLAPRHVSRLRRHGIDVVVESNQHRIFNDSEYVAAGARVVRDLTPYPIICGIKELDPARVERNKTYLFFSHTLKGQPQNLPLLRRLIEQRCTLIDYERITDHNGQRLTFFGRFAGLVGTLDSLWALGQRLSAIGRATPLAQLEPAHAYGNVATARLAIAQAGEALRQGKRPPMLRPLVIGVAGTGNAAQGAEAMLDELGARRIAPEQLEQLPRHDSGIYQVVFEVEHLVRAIDGAFDRATYFQYPHRYRSIFARYLPRLNVLINCIYWEERYPRLVTIDNLRRLYGGKHRPRLQVIGDVSCDVRGAIAATVKPTWPDNPVYVYDVERNAAVDGVEGKGPVIMAVYNLPSELPRDASEAFSRMLAPFLPAVASGDYDALLERTGLPPPIRRAVIVHRGVLAADYHYLEHFLG